MGDEASFDRMRTGIIDLPEEESGRRYEQDACLAGLEIGKHRGPDWPRFQGVWSGDVDPSLQIFSHAGTSLRKSD